VMATTVTESGGVRIITEVIPATDPRAAQLAAGSIQPTVSSFQVSGFRKAQPKVLGTIHIVTGIIHLCFGIILTCAENNSVLSLPVASGVFFWLGLLLLVSGSLLVESEKRENILLVKVCCVANAAVILSTLLAMLIHGVAITHSIPGCSSTASMPILVRQEWCFNAESKALSNGFDSILILFGLLEFCTAVAALAFGCTAIKQHSYTRMVRALLQRSLPPQALAL
ncbi:M4A15 protein, partial [Odontophorus gujanensis]|nr:M4A15 protein [Odontophorus gujanensis]